MKLLEYSNVAGEDLLYIRLSDSDIDHTEERGPLMVDLDSNGIPVGVEILDVGELLDALRNGASVEAELIEQVSAA